MQPVFQTLHHTFHVLTLGIFNANIFSFYTEIPPEILEVFILRL